MARDDLDDVIDVDDVAEVDSEVFVERIMGVQREHTSLDVVVGYLFDENAVGTCNDDPDAPRAEVELGVLI